MNATEKQQRMDYLGLILRLLDDKGYKLRAEQEETPLSERYEQIEQEIAALGRLYDDFFSERINLEKDLEDTTYDKLEHWKALVS